MWLLETPSSTTASAVPGFVRRGVEVSLSNANVEAGGLLIELVVDPRDEGRCCQDSGFDRDGAIAALGNALEKP